jgi:cyanate permease
MCQSAMQCLNSALERGATFAAVGPVILGRAFDSTGSYTSLLVILATALALAAAMNLFLPKYSDSAATDPA